MSENVHLARRGTPGEIAKAVVFLASDDSRHITGTELFVGAGFAQLEASAVSTLDIRPGAMDVTALL